MFISLFFASTTEALCPFAGGGSRGDLTPGQNSRISGRLAPRGYYEAFEKLDFDAVKADLKELFTTSQSWWPADYGNYGPLFIRLAWHNAGSYRSSDGRGGADGGRQRFDPERSWDDNTNLDKARKLLEPIKQKYGVGLSWGDLIILAGDTAIESMGGPVLGFCGGRIDDADGFWSDRLGPTADQEANQPCAVNGNCTASGGTFGTNVVGLIYVNPEGFMGNPVPKESAPQVRTTFGRMGMDDEETVALIGGGHAFGKVHGACKTGPGLYPYQDPLNPWAGTCGEGEGKGKGVNAFTSGFEGPWTVTPTSWDNQYFQNLVNFKWKKHVGPGGHWQWRVDGASPYTTFANGTGKQDIMMLTSDVSLLEDPENKYQDIVRDYASNPAKLDDKFSHAWYKLTTRDMGPVSRCMGPLVPEAQPFQNPLPAPPSTLADFEAVRASLRDVLDQAQANGPDMIRLAFRCAATFRVTDYQGGCNGARIRMSPQKDWPVNRGLDRVLSLLDPVKQQFGRGLTWADLIVLAGNTALEQAGLSKLPFCPGRSDAITTSPDPVSEKLEYMNSEPVVNGQLSASVDDLEQWTLLMGMSTREFTALMGARALGKIPTEFGMGQRVTDPYTLGTEYYNNLVKEMWASDGKKYRTSTDNGLAMLRTDLLLVAAPEYLTVVQDFAGDENLFKQTLAAAWTKLMNADRFDGPTRNLCEERRGDDSTEMEMVDDEGQNNSVLVIESASRVLLTTVLVLSVALVLAFAMIVFLLFNGNKPAPSKRHSWSKNEDMREPLRQSSHQI